jgi:hypothetical protein
MKKVLVRKAAIFAVAITVTGINATIANAAGLQAELRSSAAILPSSMPGAVAPTAPAGAAVSGEQTWVCDAFQGFAPAVAIASGGVDPSLAIGTSGGIKLPISATSVPATCGQVALQSNGVIYITQGVVDTRNTPSPARGVLRAALDPNTGALLGGSTYIATTAGLDGNQPTAAAIGPDGNLYVGFVKNGNVKRIVSPGTGSTQTVQSVGNTPQGHAARAFAFVGNDLYIASIDALSVIRDAVSPACQSGCNAQTISDGFAGVSHTGIAFDESDGLYFAVAGNPLSPGSSQIWRMSISGGTFTFVAMGGVDRNGANASNFSFVASKTNLLAVDAGGNLWIGDDTSNAGAIGAGRLWTVSSAALASLTGSSSGGTNVQAIFNVLHGPWVATLTNTATSVTTQFVPSFNPNGTFTGVLATTSANPVEVTTDSGSWTLTAPKITQPFANAQAHLTITDAGGTVLFSNDILLETVDTFTSLTSGSGSLGSGFEVQWTKFAP